MDFITACSDLDNPQSINGFSDIQFFSIMRLITIGNTFSGTICVNDATYIQDCVILKV